MVDSSFTVNYLTLPLNSVRRGVFVSVVYKELKNQMTPPATCILGQMGIRAKCIPLRPEPQFSHGFPLP